MNKDYERLLNMLDEGKEVLVRIHLLPPPYGYYDVIAHTGIDNGRKFYSVGYGEVFDRETCLRQCEGLQLEIINEWI